MDQHMPDAPLLIAAKAWNASSGCVAPLLEARDAARQEGAADVVALIRAAVSTPTR